MTFNFEILTVFQQTNLFGHPGAGGQYGYGDTECKLGVAYTTNFLYMPIGDFENFIDGRFETLLNSTYRCIGNQRRVFATYGAFLRAKESENAKERQAN